MKRSIYSGLSALFLISVITQSHCVEKQSIQRNLTIINRSDSPVEVVVGLNDQMPLSIFLEEDTETVLPFDTLDSLKIDSYGLLSRQNLGLSPIDYIGKVSPVVDEDLNTNIAVTIESPDISRWFDYPGAYLGITPYWIKVDSSKVVAGEGVTLTELLKQRPFSYAQSLMPADPKAELSPLSNDLLNMITPAVVFGMPADSSVRDTNRMYDLKKSQWQKIRTSAQDDDTRAHATKILTILGLAKDLIDIEGKTAKEIEKATDVETVKARQKLLAIIRPYTDVDERDIAIAESREKLLMALRDFSSA